MVIWSGLGFLVAVITFCSCLVANFNLDQEYGEGNCSSHPWTVGLALLIGGMISSAVGFGRKTRTDRFVIDEETRERMVINRSSHTFFLIPRHWAGLLIAIVGMGMAFIDLVAWF